MIKTKIISAIKILSDSGCKCINWRYGSDYHLPYEDGHVYNCMVKVAYLPIVWAWGLLQFVVSAYNNVQIVWM